MKISYGLRVEGELTGLNSGPNNGIRVRTAGTLAGEVVGDVVLPRSSGTSRRRVMVNKLLKIFNGDTAAASRISSRSLFRNKKIICASGIGEMVGAQSSFR